jgi:TolB-like protein/DNA-binding winged helix-turn-helix (wHTH) protein/Tfp pilus assembly protein PilF
MLSTSPLKGDIRFGVFEVDVSACELRKKGLKVKLQQQPFELLLILLERPSQVVNREELRQRLWPADVYVDFDRGLNKAMVKLREALGDSAESPLYIETLPRIGYRFIGSFTETLRSPAENVVNRLECPTEVAKPDAAAATPAPATAPTRKTRWIVAATVMAIAGLLFALNVAGWRQRSFSRIITPQIQSLVVLPFENLSGDPSQDYFVDGMTDALISDLGQISSLRVISRTSAMQYKAARMPLPKIASELNVEGVVQGTVARSGNRVRITAQLIEARTDRHLWARTYERDIRDVLALQDEVARSVADEIKVKLTAQDRARFASARPVVPEAHEEYLKGRYFLAKPDPQDISKGIEHLELAVKEDPDYAQAYAALSTAYIFYAGLSGPLQALPKARAAARKALELDDTLAEPHTSLAMIAFVYDWDWDGAGKEFTRTLDSNPGEAGAHASYAAYLIAMGNADEAVAEVKTAQSLDPLSPEMNGDLTEILYMARQYDQLIALCQKMLELDPNSLPAHSSLNLAYEQKQMFAEAAAHEEQVLTLVGTSDLATAFRQNYLRSGYRAAWRKLLDEYVKRSSRGFFSPYGLGAGYSFLDEKNSAFRWLGQAYDKRSPGLSFIKVDPRLDPLRSDPRFQDLLRRMNFPG